MSRLAALLALMGLVCGAAAEPLPELRVTRDNTVVDHSCRVVIEPGVVISDDDDNGVLQFVGDGLTIEFAEGSVLRGAGPIPTTPDDQLRGTGIRIEGSSGVTLRGARIAGYKAGVHAAKADGLVLEDISVERNFRQRLNSSPMAEASTDWLWPHDNDEHQWLTRYGSGVAVERSSKVTIRNVRVRQSQNGIILDRVNESRVESCDCSFLSGWGLAMWRSSRNQIVGNAFDYCIRGYSHGIYNRGQDSAGILCFEQCSFNRFERNSATHCGDGFFGFAGKEALGQSPRPDAEFDYAKSGCNSNVLLANDFSHAAAHGIEMTFSFANEIRGNRLVGNAICGVWGGYSQQTLIEGNWFEDNGQLGAAEGGGINIEHGFENRILDNDFTRNVASIVLWSDDDGELLKSPWAVANHRGSDQNVVVSNRFKQETAWLRVRKTPVTLAAGNQFEESPETVDADPESRIEPAVSNAAARERAEIAAEPAGRSPIGKRDHLGGRESIIMGEWGPWDHQTPMIRRGSASSSHVVYELYGDVGAVEINVLQGKGDLETDLGAVEPDLPRTVRLKARPGIQVLPYRVRLKARGIDEHVAGTLVDSPWVATVFKFPGDPRADVEAWRAAAESQGVSVSCDDLGWLRGLSRGIDKLPMFREAVPSGRVPGREHFGLRARTRVRMPAGTWRVTTRSDDGVRVLIDQKAVLENWTHHAPTIDSGLWTTDVEKVVEVVVEYFQLDGFATLELAIDVEPAPAR